MKFKLFFLYRQLLEKELETVGIRLNKEKPNIYFKVSKLLNTNSYLVILTYS